MNCSDPDREQSKKRTHYLSWALGVLQPDNTTIITIIIIIICIKEGSPAGSANGIGRSRNQAERHHEIKTHQLDKLRDYDVDILQGVVRWPLATL